MDRKEIREIYHFAIFKQYLFQKMSTNVMFKYNRS